jgi:glycosyltransferase involved in cell wall biosynthesis
MVRISGVINTLNERENIRYAIASVASWCDEVVVVDQYSDDGTADIARSMGARVFDHVRTGIADPARQFALEQSTGDWVLLLDADECVHPALGRRLRELAEADGPYDVVWTPYVNIVLGRWMRYGRWWPGRRARFYRRDSVILSGRIHGGIKPVPGARPFVLPARKDLAIWHFSYHSLSDLMEKTNRYTSIQARQQLERRPLRVRPYGLFRKAAGNLWREYIRGRGYRDGMAGLTVGVIKAFYWFLVAAKHWDEPRIEARLRLHDAVRERLLAGSPHLAGEAVAGDGGVEPSR